MNMKTINYINEENFKVDIEILSMNKIDYLYDWCSEEYDVEFAYIENGVKDEEINKGKIVKDEETGKYFLRHRGYNLVEVEM